MLDKYSKAIAAFIVAATITIQTVFPTYHWANTIVAGLGVLLVWFVPNAPTGQRITLPVQPPHLPPPARGDIMIPMPGMPGMPPAEPPHQ